MTRQRNDSHSTEFGIWLRVQPQIDSSLGFLASNIDYCWTNYKTGEWMFIEEKRYNTAIKYWQKKLFSIMHNVCRADKKYRGFHLLVFENTSPEDGKIFLDNKEISKEQLLNFLSFKL